MCETLAFSKQVIVKHFRTSSDKRSKQNIRCSKQEAQWAREGYQLLMVGYVMDGNVDNLRPRIEELKSLIG